MVSIPDANLNDQHNRIIITNAFILTVVLKVLTVVFLLFYEYKPCIWYLAVLLFQCLSYDQL